MTALIDLKRNDIPGAIEYAAGKIKTGGLSPEDAHVLLMLQDDPSELIEQLETLKEE
ncbi:MAG: hypothetical protein GY838_12825 [bacterium]|nr:hypothetical protein [bacterium]